MEYSQAVPMLSPLEADLDRLHTLLLQGCVRAETMVRQSVRSVTEKDARLGRAVVMSDTELDRLEQQVDNLCLRCLALRQPVGRQLRLVTTALKMGTDLERVGDLAVNIAERGLELTAGSGFEAGFQLREMGELAASMLREAADGLLEEDSSVAARLQELDTRLDAYNKEAFRSSIARMTDYPEQADRLLSLTSISRHLERVGDHAVNLGEMVVFLVEGRDIRHL